MSTLTVWTVVSPGPRVKITSRADFEGDLLDLPGEARRLAALAESAAVIGA
jgi:hypothetical protein